MTRLPKGGVFMQDKNEMMQLADVIASSKERDARQKIDRTKAAASAPVQQKHGKRPNSSPASDRLRAAKELIAARKARHKRAKTRARKSDGQASKPVPVPAGDGSLSFGTQSASTATTAKAKRKRVLFA